MSTTTRASKDTSSNQTATLTLDAMHGAIKIGQDEK
jgi:hypothetical protein